MPVTEGVRHNRSIGWTPIWLSVAEAAITTTAMISPGADLPQSSRASRRGRRCACSRTGDRVRTSAEMRLCTAVHGVCG